MKKFAIAFISDDNKDQLRHRIIEGDSQEVVLKVFFEEELTEFYSNDEKGYAYFKEDFYNSIPKSGSIIEV